MSYFRQTLGVLAAAAVIILGHPALAETPEPLSFASLAALAAVEFPIRREAFAERDGRGDVDSEASPARPPAAPDLPG